MKLKYEMKIIKYKKHDYKINKKNKPMKKMLNQKKNT